MRNEAFKLPTSSYEEVTKIIRAYAGIDNPVGLDEIAHRTGLNKSMVSGNHAFLKSIGLIEGGNRKALTSLGKMLASVLEYEDRLPDEVARAWREIVEQSEFLQKMITAVRIRRGMDRVALEGHIAYSAGERKNQKTMTGARTTIEILKRARLLDEVDGKLTVIAPDLALPHALPQGDDATDKSKLPPTSPLTSVEAISARSASGVRVQVNINIDATPEDLDGLGPRLARLFQVLQTKLEERPMPDEADIAEE